MMSGVDRLLHQGVQAARQPVNAPAINESGPRYSFTFIPEVMPPSGLFSRIAVSVDERGGAMPPKHLDGAGRRTRRPKVYIAVWKRFRSRRGGAATDPLDPVVPAGEAIHLKADGKTELADMPA